MVMLYISKYWCWYTLFQLYGFMLLYWSVPLFIKYHLFFRQAHILFWSVFTWLLYCLIPLGLLGLLLAIFVYEQMHVTCIMKRLLPASDLSPRRLSPMMHCSSQIHKSVMTWKYQYLIKHFHVKKFELGNVIISIFQNVKLALVGLQNRLYC